jgi:NADPH2:quinone reductase
MRGMKGPGLRPTRLPLIPGIDMAGEIDALGDGVPAAQWALGQRVVAYPGVYCGSCGACRSGEESMCERYEILGEERDGGLAEYAVLPASNLERIPEGVAWTKAAALPVAFGTAWRMLITAAEARPGGTLLVVGIGSGVSTALVGLARRFGIRVLATTRSAAKAALAQSIGVDAVQVGYETPFDAWVMEQTGGVGVDVVADSVGAATWRMSIRSLKRGGSMVICGASSGDDPSFSIRELYQNHRRILGAPLGNRRDFRDAVQTVFREGIEPVIDSVTPLSEVRSAFERLSRGEQFGKLVVDIS